MAIAENPEDMLTLLALKELKTGTAKKQGPPKEKATGPYKTRPQTCDICGKTDLKGWTGLAAHKRLAHLKGKEVKRGLLDDPIENRAKAPYKPISELPPLR